MASAGFTLASTVRRPTIGIVSEEAMWRTHSAECVVVQRGGFFPSAWDGIPMVRFGAGWDGRDEVLDD